MLKKILIIVALAVVGFLVVVALQPTDFRLTRSASMAIPPAAIFAQVNDFRRWEAWSPWEKIDPAMKQTYEGAPAGVGAIYSWAGNNEVGEGRMTIIESRPHELIRINLEFFKPFAATNTTEFTFKPEGDKTVVAWTMTGEKNFIAKAAHLFMDIEKMVGSQFEQGLAGLEAAAAAGR